MNWTTMKSLHSLYLDGTTEAKKTVLEDDEIKFLLNSTQELTHVNKIIKVNPNEDFSKTYKRDY